jgi:drug/metabolite transporter (DMT)-like permease
LYSTVVIFGAELAVVFGSAWWLRPREAPAAPRADGKAAVSRDDEKEKTQTLTLVVALICWVAAGVTITVFNKWLFNAAMGDFPYPVTLVALHQGFVAVLMQILSVGAPGTIPAIAEKGILVGLSPAAFLSTALPPGVLYAASLALGNKAALCLTVSFASMLKAGKPALVFMASVAFGLEPWDGASFCLVILVCCGCALVSLGEVDFSVIGFTYQMLTFVAEVGRLLTLKKLVSMPSLDSLSALAVFSLSCCVAVVPAAAVEWDAALLGRMYELRGLLLMSCVLAALVNFATINFMKVATPTVVSLAGMLPVVLSTAASTVVFHSTLSRLQEVGFATTLLLMQAHFFYESRKTKR